MFVALMSTRRHFRAPSQRLFSLRFGKTISPGTARRFAQLDRIILLCGRYEGVDERVAEHLATDELSIGDYVLSGGELGAALIVDATTRLLPGALGNEDSSINESFSVFDADSISSLQTGNHDSRFTNHGLLDSRTTRVPPEFRGWPVPEILLGGIMRNSPVASRESAGENQANRPDLLATESRSRDE